MALCMIIYTWKCVQLSLRHRNRRIPQSYSDFSIVFLKLVDNDILSTFIMYLYHKNVNISFLYVSYRLNYHSVELNSMSIEVKRQKNVIINSKVLKMEQTTIPTETYIWKYEWIDYAILICLLSRSSNALRVKTGHKPCYEEYVELRVWIYEGVRRLKFYSCALRLRRRRK